MQPETHPQHPEQGSAEWLALRQSKITASNLPVIMGVSPYATVYELWKEKTGRVAPAKASGAMVYGTQMEPILRGLYFKMTGIQSEPTLSFHPEHGWLMASLDGLSPDGKVIFEAKTCSWDLYEQCQSNKNYIISHHWWQLQAQLACTPSAEYVDYMLFYRGKEPLIRKVYRETEKFQLGIERAHEFWLCVKEDRAPAMTMEDHRWVENDAKFEAAASEWRKVKAEEKRAAAILKEIEKREALARENLLALNDGGSAEGYGVKIDRIIKKGTIQYKEIPELDGINLDKYREAATIQYRITGADSD